MFDKYIIIGSFNRVKTVFEPFVNLLQLVSLISLVEHMVDTIKKFDNMFY